ncbi:hypothetical protein [Paenarthrobacter nitroguajacolicus]|uniref:hypothetical protein n=1 Tax=Paenarthrobacter nitroguajacolicus TaxID=211146 RepID=UPI0015C15D55|nr:hypothetical protein [Paenarthrobacter nitroguajacolicus]NWL31956.1 hypothetical protein [Paenarthrobacter nitroguajacolicus]
MAENIIEWKHIGEERFNRIVEALLMRLFHKPPHSTAEVIDGRGGDGGIDVAVYVNGRIDRIFQLKHFPEGFSGGFRETRRPQIKDSFDTAWTNHQPPRWTLVFPGNPTVRESKYITGLGKGKNVTPTMWGIARLDSELAPHRDLLEWATRDSLVETLAKFHQEKAALAGPDDLHERLTNLHDLASSRSAFWAVDLSVSEHGVTQVIRAKDPRAAEMEPLGFRFNLTGENRKLADSLQGVLDFGVRRRVSIPGSAIKDFASIGPEWFTPKGEIERVEFRGPEPLPNDEQVRVTLDFLDERGFSQTTHQGLLTASSRGPKGKAFTAIFYGIFELDAEIPYDLTSSGNTVMSATVEKATVKDALDSLRLIENFEQASNFRILFEGQQIAQVETAEDGPLGLIDASTRLLIEDLGVLEQRLGASFFVPSSLSPLERVMIRVARLLSEGKSTWMPPQISLTMKVAEDGLEEAEQNLLEGHAVFMPLQTFPVEIQGSKFDLGPTGLFHPHVVARDAEEILKAFAAGTAAGRVVTFVPQGERLVRGIPLGDISAPSEPVDWGLQPDIAVPNLELQDRSMLAVSGELEDA